MAQSSEYPDLKWMPPYAFGTGRDGKAVRYIVIHYTAGAERNTSAEDGAVYDQDRRDGVSTHYFADSNSVVQCVLTRNRANACFHKGNRLGIQYELCGTVQTRAQWLDAASLPTLKNAARQVARDCRKYGIPVRRLTVAETRSCWYDFPNGPKGIVGHVDVTNAYPEDGGTHTDPGPQFPWDVFLGLVRAELEDDMTKDELLDALKEQAFKDAIYNAVNQDRVQRYDANGGPVPADPAKPGESTMTWASALQYLGKDTALIKKALTGLAAKDVVDEQALAALVAAQVVAALPQGADQVSQDEVTQAVQTAFRQAFSS